MFNPDQLIGSPFFYADEETGIGWTSRIDEILRNWDTDSYILELSCGTRVKISYSDFIKNGKKVFYTNLKETNG